MSTRPYYIMVISTGPEDTRQREVLSEHQTYGEAVAEYERLRKRGEDIGCIILLDPVDTVIFGCSY